MNKLILLCAALLICYSTSAQKIQYKKGKVLVNKVEQFDFTKIRDGGMATFSDYMLTDNSGKELLEVLDNTYYYTQLKHEKNKRHFENAYKLKLPGTELEAVVALPSLNPRKYIIKKLDNLGFFKTKSIDEKMFKALGEHFKHRSLGDKLVVLDSINLHREKNYKMNAATFGEYPERIPGKIRVDETIIKDGSTKIGRFKLEERGSYAQVYIVLNLKGKVIGTYTIIPSKHNANFYPVLDIDLRQWFYFSVNSNGDSMTLEQKFRQAAEYLVLHGFL